MIYGCFGNVGSGKTVFAVRLAYKAFLKGYTVMSNVKLRFDHEPVNLEKLLKFDINKCVLLLDEAYGFGLESRVSSSLVNRALSYFVLQSRKRGVHIIYTSQFYSALDKRIRLLTNRKILCQKILPYFRYTVFLPNGSFFIMHFHVRQMMPIFKLFDSNEYYDVKEIFKSHAYVKKLLQEVEHR